MAEQKPDEPKPDQKAGGSESQKQKDGELIHGRFKTHEEASAAYPEAEKAMTQALQEAADLKRQFQELQNMQVTQQPAAQQPQEDINELFWKSPVEVINRVVAQGLEPVYKNYYETQKDKFRSDPEFQKYESQIDFIANQYPNLKTQTNIIGQLYKMVKGLNFDEGAYKNQVREEVKNEMLNTQLGSVEGGSAGRLPGGNLPVNQELSDDEKRVAEKFYMPDGLSREDAYKKYAEVKVKHGGM